MMTGLISRAWQTVKPHVPLIKFKKGNASQAAPTASAPAPKGDKQAAPSIKTVTLPSIEDWQLPARYRRQMLDEKEIESINSGGAY